MQITEAVISWGHSIMLFGIPVYISYWTLALAILLTVEAKLYIDRQLDTLEHSIRCTPGGLLIGSACGAVFLILSVAAHELGHAVVASYFGYPITGAGVSWWGAYVSLPDSMDQASVWVGIAVAFAGPATNMALAFLLAIPVRILGESVPENTLQFVSYMNWRLGKLNFLPLIVLDGGKVFSGLLRLYFSQETALQITLFVTVFFFIMWISKTKKKKRKSFEPSDPFEAWLERA